MWVTQEKWFLTYQFLVVFVASGYAQHERCAALTIFIKTKKYIIRNIIRNISRNILRNIRNIIM